MKILISTNLPTFRSVLGDDSSQVCFSLPDSNIAQRLNGLIPIDLWICQGSEVTEELVDQWSHRNWNSPKVLLVHDAELVPHLQNLSKGRVAEIQAIPKQEQDEPSWVVSTLQAGERLYARSCARGAVRPKEVILDLPAKRTVVLVGAGIMNLVTADFLATRGFRVRVVDAGPDPRTCEDWTRLGTTHGGGDARMFTFTEADCYNERGSDIYHNMRQVFRKTALNGGWSLKSNTNFNTAEIAWVKTFEQLPAWLAKAFKEDIYYVNKVAGKLWTEYKDRSPELFGGVSFHANILRLYVEETALTEAYKLNRRLGAVVEEFSQSELLSEYTGFRAAAESGELAGGLTVQGFTLAIHSFVDKLINRIMGLGGDFTWNCRVERIQRNASGEVTLLESQHGALHADNFVISAGVPQNGLLEGTASENLIHGVLGVWLRIPNLNPMINRSIKIHRRGCLVEDINVTVSRDIKTGEDILIFGGGYGYVGSGRPPPECPELQALFDELEKVAQIYFPEAYQVAKEQGALWPDGERNFCIRPFTCTSLGIFEDIPTTSGGRLVITGGNNTGGFAQAPAIARAVCCAMVGEHDPIHALFSPHRGRLATQQENVSHL
ncbi:hypothetical protein BKA58DRAFT_324505 [Alternaria rosae]|uniref:uncharacterized protein n=1 Tax=Alternaria rosae TaxID=1187941 RepID=UPI001E8D0DA2|nr:uncharacterized protein BKA58DRAFT_324505 [Alternaria rosae]KAH6858819.1 hypothetical protein BKA58DRAFT_324505 [Alternaria rosae]